MCTHAHICTHSCPGYTILGSAHPVMSAELSFVRVGKVPGKPNICPGKRHAFPSAQGSSKNQKLAQNGVQLPGEHRAGVEGTGTHKEQVPGMQVLRYAPASMWAGVPPQTWGLRAPRSSSTCSPRSWLLASPCFFMTQEGPGLGAVTLTFITAFQALPLLHRWPPSVCLSPDAGPIQIGTPGIISHHDYPLLHSQAPELVTKMCFPGTSSHSGDFRTWGRRRHGHAFFLSDSTSEPCGQAHS